MYDVFLSFRGETRASFVSHLYTTLRNAGLCVFRDDDEIRRGDHLSVSLLQAIKSSKIFVIVLSPNYANSRWCMQEFENIMEIHRAMGAVVVPVFYKVDPSEVRNQKGKFGEAFEDLMSKKSVDDHIKRKWKIALLEVGGIAGFVIINSKNENEDIKNIVKHVNLLLGRTKLFVTNHPVGVESRVQDAIDQLNIHQLKEVLLLGIWGMGGTGKTTIAKAIYNQIENKFASRSFLPNIREVWEQQTNQVALQQRLLDDIFETMTMKIHSVESGKNILKERLPQKKVLVVLDDVDKLDQLNALCGSHEWFHPESIIIITTRNERLLKLHKVDHVHTIEKMNQSESLELFCWYAFKKASPEYNFSRLSRDIVAYSQGLPLALQILGSCLFDRGITEWESVIRKLKKIPNDEMQEKLRISFDSLNKSEKEIFLDIACFFIGMDRNDVMQILNCSGIFVGLEITVLVERSLVTVDNKNRLQMHDLLKYMGREITREESPNDPEERNRLWLDEEVLDILSKNKGTKAVKGLALMLSGKDIIRLKTKAFRKMNRLRLLQLSRVRLEGDFKYLRDLRWLCWHGFPSTHAPTEFQQESLVAIDLQYSKLKQIWKNSQKCLENLKILNLSHSWDLTEIPDFSYFPNLEKLVLKDCPSLSTVSHTIGYLHKLLLINLEDCTGLLSLPRSIYKLKSLETLILSGCLKIDKLEEDLQMESLTTLIAANTAITKVSFSMMHRLEKLKILNLSHSHYLTETPDFSSLPNLEELVLKNCTSLSVVSQTIGCLHKLLLINLEDCTGLIGLPRSIYKLKSLETFILSRCLMIGKLEEDLEQMDSLTSLIADATAIVTVPYSIVRLKSIEYISLCGFKGFSHDVFPSLVWSWMSPTNDMLYLVPMSPSMEFPDDSSWNLFSAEDLSKFKLRYLLVKFGSERQLTQFVAGILIDCRSQVHIPGSKNYLNSDLFIQMGTKCQVPNIVDDIILQTTEETGDWLSFSCKGCSVTFEVPKMKGNLKSTMFRVIYSSSPDNITSTGFQNVLIINHTKTIIQVFKTDLTFVEDEEWQSITSNLEPGNRVEVMVVFGERFVVEKTTVYLLYEEETIHKEMDVIVSSDDDDKNVSVSSGHDMSPDNNFTLSGGDDNDVPVDKNVIIFGEEDENVSKDKHRHDVVGGDVIVSGEDGMAANKNVLSGGDHENRSRRLFILPSIVKAVLISRPVWIGLGGILVWITCRHFKKRRSQNPITRYTQWEKWLVDCAKKLIPYKKANEPHGVIVGRSGRVN